MAYAEIKRRLDAGEVLLLDGGVGTELERRGADMDPAAWCGVATLENEELLTQIHIDYARAGSDVITANTFASSRVMLSAAGHGDDVVEINQRAVEAALRAKEQLATEGRTVAVAGLGAGAGVAARAAVAVVEAGGTVAATPDTTFPFLTMGAMTTSFRRRTEGSEEAQDRHDQASKFSRLQRPARPSPGQTACSQAAASSAFRVRWAP
jgi:methionine synthase I (cobalamin-dependent)